MNQDSTKRLHQDRDEEDDIFLASLQVLNERKDLPYSSSHKVNFQVSLEAKLLPLYYRNLRNNLLCFPYCERSNEAYCFTEKGFAGVCSPPLRIGLCWESLDSLGTILVPCMVSVPQGQRANLFALGSTESAQEWETRGIIMTRYGCDTAKLGQVNTLTFEPKGWHLTSCTRWKPMETKQFDLVFLVFQQQVTTTRVGGAVLRQRLVANAPATLLWSCIIHTFSVQSAKPPTKASVDKEE